MAIQKSKQKKKTVPRKKAAAKKSVSPQKSFKKKRASAAKPKKKKTVGPLGTVTHFYTDISVAIVRFKQNVPAGTNLLFKGATTEFKQPAISMQYDHAPVTIAKKGKQIGIKVKKRVREGDAVHKAD